MGREQAKPIAVTADKTQLPHHVAIIMDGNGRWASSRGIPRAEGHEAGVRNLSNIVTAAAEMGLRVLTVFAFSTENAERPSGETDYLLRLLDQGLEEETDRLQRINVRVRFIGARAGLPAHTLQAMDEAEKFVPDEPYMLLNVAWNYGGRADICEAARELARKVASGQLDAADIDETTFSMHLSTAGVPDPDLLIRTGGDHRISNFLLWQIAYTELWVTPVYWPDFSGVHLHQAISEYQKRDRRFGRI